MKRKVSILVLAMVLMLSQVSMAKSNAVISNRKTFNVNNRKATVNVVTVDLNNPNTRLEVVTANDKIGGHEDFSNMIKRKKPKVAINANYFDAYKTLEPIGTIMVNNRIEFLDGSPVSMVITNNGKVNIAPYNVDITGYINGNRKDSWNSETKSMDYFTFKIWQVNKSPEKSSGVCLYTPARGKSVKLNNGVAIEVRKDKVTKIIENAKEVNIPKDGYIIYYADNEHLRSYAALRFNVGDTIELEYDVEEATNNPKVMVDQILLHGCLNEQTKNYWSSNPDEIVYNLFNTWYVNIEPIDPKGVYLYTKEIGETITPNSGHAIVVTDGKVSSIEYDVSEVEIPEDGFVIYYAEDSVKKDYIENRFKIGYTVDFFHKDSSKIDTKNIIEKAVKDNAKSLKGSKVKSIISAGPYLVEDGKVVFDPESSGFKEDKITKNRAQRSAVGITKNNKLILVTGSSLTMKELAQIMVKLGADRAMNLDGGASSALYANGKTITPAGRKLHTVLMVW